MQTVKDIVETKRAGGLMISDPGRERAILQRLTTAHDPIYEGDLKLIYSLLFDLSRSAQARLLRPDTEPFMDAVDAGKPYDLELQLRIADGTQKWVRTIGRPVWKDGKVVKVTGNIMDITDRKKAEDEKTILDRMSDSWLDAGTENAANPHGVRPVTVPRGTSGSAAVRCRHT